MLPHAVASRSSESWSQTCSAPSDGCASSRSPSSIELARPGDELVAGHGRRPRRGSSPRGPPGRVASTARARPSPIGAPSNRVTGRMPATLDTGTPRRRAARSSRRSRPSTGRSPTRAAQSSSQERVVPGQDRAVERRRRQLSDPVGGATDQEDVGGRALRQVVVDGQEQRVVGARPGAPRAGRRRSPPGTWS